MTRAQYDALREAVESFDPESDDPSHLLIGTGVDAYDLAVDLLEMVDHQKAQVNQ